MEGENVRRDGMKAEWAAGARLGVWHVCQPVRQTAASNEYSDMVGICFHG